MKTDDLIALLATGDTAVRPHSPERRWGRALSLSLPVALALVWAMGLRPDLMDVLSNPMLWVKFAYPGAVAALSLLLLVRVSCPGMALGALPRSLLVPVAAMAALAALVLLNAEASQRPALVMGDTWRLCTLNIVLVGAPVFVASFWALRGLAPTQLALAGACAGLLAGAAGAVVYALHCPEMQAPFLLVWNGLGMLLPAALGAALGPRWLRW